MKYGFALNVAIPKEYWNKQGWSVLVRFNGINVNSGSFQIWNANFFNFFRKSNALEILIHQKHFIGNDITDAHAFLLVVDKMTMSDLRKFHLSIYSANIHFSRILLFHRSSEETSMF